MKLQEVLYLAGVAGFAAACSSTSDTPTPADYDDVAQALSATVATSGGGGEIGSIHDAVNLAISQSPGGLTLQADGNILGNKLGVDYMYKLSCSDASGTAQQQCGSSTDAAQVEVKWNGNLSLPLLSADVQRDGNWQLSKLQSDHAALSGTSNLDMDLQFQSIFRNISRDYHLSYAANYDGVQIAHDPLAVVGGQVHYTVEAERKASTPRHESDADFHIDALLSFAADGGATLTLDGNYKYQVDPSSGQVSKM